MEKIQHKLGMALKGGSTFKRNSRVTVSVRLTNGAPVPDGLLVSLITQVGGRNYRSNARTRGGLRHLHPEPARVRRRQAWNHDRVQRREAPVPSGPRYCPRGIDRQVS
ncbi:MAG: hypothetical protein M5U19_22520 [Microthrixaceae bacterium]|nr:hypothetical protein [Microthrixaceae bacterium]